MVRPASRHLLSFAVFLVAGCTDSPRLAIASNGQLPDKPPISYGFAPIDGDDGLADARTRIGACLAQRGLQASDSPAYLVQIGLSDHPRRAGVFSGEEKAGPDGNRPWIDAPRAVGRKQWSRALSMSVSAVAGGQEAYRVRVTMPYRQGRPTKSPADLADAACAAMLGAAAG
jgi:hypothetical protein